MDETAASRVVLRNIEVPHVVLEASSCDATLRVPSPQTTLEECNTLLTASRRAHFSVPDGSSPGCILRVPIQEGNIIEVPLPEDTSSGDPVCLMQRLDGTWRVMKQTTAYAFLIPACEPEDVLQRQLPDGTYLSFTVPEGVDPGELVALRMHKEDGWAIDKVYVLPEVHEMPTISEYVCGPYSAALQLIKGMPCLASTHVSRDGVLQVNVPFCGRFQEYVQLCDFVAEHCLSRPGIRKAIIFGTEALDTYYYDWGLAQKWCSKVHPQIELNICVRDLSEDPLPMAGLTIGIHPEVTKGGYWFPIIGSLVKSTIGGLCVLATFYEDEMQTIINMINMYKSESSKVEVINNPYYDIHPMPETGRSPRMRYLILVDSTSSPA